MILRFKRGTTVRLRCTHSLSGSTVNLTGYTLAASARLGTASARPLTVTIDPDQTANRGVFTLTSDTTSWELGRHRVDVRFTTPSADRYYSETFQIDITEPVT